MQEDIRNELKKELLWIRYQRYRELKRWRSLLPELKRAIHHVLPDAEIYVFGSAVREELTANSDVDVLVVSPEAVGRKRHQLASDIEEEVDKLTTLPIFEIHLVPPQKLEWFAKHVKELVSIDELIRHKQFWSARAETANP